MGVQQSSPARGTSGRTTLSDANVVGRAAERHRGCAGVYTGALTVFILEEEFLSTGRAATASVYRDAVVPAPAVDLLL